MFLHQAYKSSCRFVPSLENVLAKIVVPNSAPTSLRLCRAITTTQCCCTKFPNCSQSDRCHHIHKSDNVASSLNIGNKGCRMYSTGSNQIKEPPQRRVYKLMKIKAKDFEKVNPDTYFEGLEPSMVKTKFEQSKELEDANDMVKKLFSLEVANQKEINEKQIQVLNKKVQMDPDNENRYAMLVVKPTVLIRSSSRRLQSYQHRKDVGSKVRLIHLIDRRRKMLKLLSRQNFAQFEKVKKELEIDYVPFGRYDFFPQSKRMKEKNEIFVEARNQREAALKEYMETVRRPQQLLEIAQLKRDLGKELTEKEQERLRQSEEVEA